jgi:hypothetical protein
LFIFLGVATSTAQAESLEDALQDFRAKLFAYFKNQPEPILPIFLPSGEIPGDVYRDAFGGFSFRQKDCFDKPRVDPSPTRLMRVIDVKSTDASGALKGQLGQVADAGGNADVKVDDRIEIRFDEVTIHITPDIEFKKTFRQNEPSCKEIEELMSKPGEGNTKLILGQVLIGKQIVETTASVSLSGEAKGGVDSDVIEKKFGLFAKAFKKLGLELKLNIASDASGSRKTDRIISLTDDRPLPIGYRPAFISQRHLQKILTYTKNGILQEIENVVIKTKNAKAVAEKYREVVVPPKELFVEMASGNLVPFDIKNSNHLEYLKGTGFLFSIGTEIWS